MNDLLYFHSSTCLPRQREVKFYLRVLKEKLYPLFPDVDAEIEKEMKEVEEAFNHSFDPERHDPADFHETLHDKSIDYGLSICEMNGYIALLAISGLYHLWERRVIEFLIREMQHCWKEEYLKINTFDEIKHNFLDYGINLEGMIFYYDLNELRLVANTVKHGDGHSLDKLRKINAAILYNKGMDGEIHTGNWTISSVDLYPTEEHIDRYGNALIQFWDHELWAKEGEYRHRTREVSERSFKKMPKTKKS